jgi:hypothetical protein
VWWLASIIGLEKGLINHIDNLHGRIDISKERHPEEASLPAVRNTVLVRDSTAEVTKVDHQATVLKECEEYLKESRRLRDIAALKSTGKTQTGQINPLATNKENLRISKKALRKKVRPKKALGGKHKKPAKDHSKTEGISDTEITRRKETGECLRCGWPADRKGAHRVRDCI